MKKNLTYLNNKVDKFWLIEVSENSHKITWGNVGTIGKKSTKVFPNERDCLKEAGKRIILKLKKGYTESNEGFLERKILPQDLEKVLRRKRIVKFTGNKVIFFSLHEVQLITLLVDHHQGNVSTVISGNPYADENGLFCSTAYVLGKISFHATDNDAVFVWLPGLKLYGIWDAHTYQLVIVPGAAWKDVEKNLYKYLKHPDRHSFSNLLHCFKVWEHFHFIPHDLNGQAEKILSLSGITRERKVDKFLNEYEYKLQSLPFTLALEDAFKALVTLYYAKGQWLEGDSQYSKAIEWFELSLPIINQSLYFRSKLFRDIFLQLSFCHLETAGFDNAVRYINIYQTYDESSRQACDQIKASIYRTQQLYKESVNRYLSSVEKDSEGGFEKAIEIVENAINVSPHDPMLHFNLACFYSSTGRTEEALYHLEEAFKKGFKNGERVLSDRDLENIRRTREFEDIHLKYLLRQ
jgi:predicted DNA-binding WGR domain protein/tetratricopeptide (TPR) repeat protein